MWDSSNCHPDIALSDDRSTATKTKSNDAIVFLQSDNLSRRQAFKWIAFVNAPFVHLHFSFSIGVCVCPSDPKEKSEFLRSVLSRSCTGKPTSPFYGIGSLNRVFAGHKLLICHEYMREDRASLQILSRDERNTELQLLHNEITVPSESELVPFLFLYREGHSLSILPSSSW